MKRAFVYFMASVLAPAGAAFSQFIPPGWGDLLSSVRGDTLCIKDYYDCGNRTNSLYEVMFSDTIGVPAGRVYGLRAGGFYPLDKSPTSSPNHPTVIVGMDLDITSVVKNKNVDSPPPLVCANWLIGAQSTGVWGISAGGDLTIRNCELVPAVNDGFVGTTFIGSMASNINVLVDNCILEHVGWAFVAMAGTNCNLTFRNCYFVNMGGQPWRGDGGVFDCFAGQSTLLVENCTHVMAQGGVYRFRSYPFGRVTVNHNTFINCAGPVFVNPGYQSRMALTNNIFVNCNILPYPHIRDIDPYNQDPDFQPMGLVNIYPDSADVANHTMRKFLVRNNLAWWDPYLNDMNATLNTNHVNGVTTWQSQMITMNLRTDSMFKHLGPYQATQYAYLLSDTWNHQMPTFADAKNLFVTTSGGALYNLKAFALAAVDTSPAGTAAVLPSWRLVNVDANSFVYPDWPVPVDLSYTDAALKTGGIGRFPLGDLNWFLTQRAMWLAQRDAEYADIWRNLNDAVNRPAGPVPAAVHLDQNYPNPFNPATAISYQLPAAGFVTIKVYDILGGEVATLVDERQSAGPHVVRFDGSALASGVYFYRLTADRHEATGKMTLIR